MKRLDQLTVALFLFVTFGLAALFWVLPDRAFSREENRSLQTSPALSLENLASGKLLQDVNAYFSDQFPFRDLWVGVKGGAEMALGRGENNGILLGSSGHLARRRFSMKRADGEVTVVSDAYDPTHVRNSCKGINRAEENLDVPFYVMLTGRNVDINGSAFDYPRDASDALQREISDALSPSVQTVDTIPLLCEHAEAGEAVYYRTDHHWTSLGAYHAYAETMKTLGLSDQILPMEAFERRTVSTDFYGTLWSAGGMRWVSPDAVELWIRGNEDAFSVVTDGKEQDGFYNEEWLSKKDHYSAFLDGTHDVVTVTRRDGAPRERLLLIKDSFANALAPFLAQHFDLVLCNLSSTRQDYTNVSALAREYDADAVMLVYTVENLLTADRLCRLK